MAQSKYIWATDLAQFDVNDEALEKFKKFDTSDEALQDAIEHFCGMGCDVTILTIYVAELELHLTNIQMKEYRENTTPKYKAYTVHLANK